MIGEFELMRLMVNCASLDGQDQLSELIGSADFSEHRRALEVAVSCFLLTKGNVEKNKIAAIKLVESQRVGLGFTATLRLEVLSSLLTEIGCLSIETGSAGAGNETRH